MTQAAPHNLMENNTGTDGLMELMSKPITRVLFLAVMVAVVFLPGHTINMILSENFVLDIEDQEKWSSGGNNFRRLALAGRFDRNLRALDWSEHHVVN